MEYKVVKRDGSYVPFDPTKIKNAIYKAILASHTQEELKERFSNEILDDITNQVVEKCQDITSTQHILIIPKDIKDNETTFKTGVAISINDIQDIVEKTLIRNGFADTAKAYIVYRAKRDDIRNSRDSINKAISDVLMSDSKDSDTKRENANIDGNTAMGTMLQVGANVSKNYYLNNMMSKDIAKAHTDGYIHIHDLDFYKLTVTCCQIDFKKLSKDGFNPGHGFVREPQSIGSYATLAAIAIQSDQGDCHGGQSIPNFDYSMTPGIYKSFRKAWNKNITKFKNFTGTIIQSDAVDKLKYADNFTDELIEDILGFKPPSPSYCVMDEDDRFDVKCMYDILILATLDDIERECYQAMEAFVHNLNTLHARAGGQLPFSSINLGTDTSNAGRMVIKNLLLAMEAGLGHGETCIFPIVIFKVKEGVNYNPEDPNYDLLQLSYRVTGKRLFPNYLYLDAPFNLQYYKPGHPETEVATMGK